MDSVSDTKATPEVDQKNPKKNNSSDQVSAGVPNDEHATTTTNRNPPQQPGFQLTIPKLPLFQSTILPSQKMRFINDASIQFQSGGVFNQPLEKFLFIYSNDHLRHLATRTVQVKQEEKRRFYLFACKPASDVTIASDPKANRLKHDNNMLLIRLMKFYEDTISSKGNDLPPSCCPDGSVIQRIVNHKYMVHLLISAKANDGVRSIAACSFVIHSQSEVAICLAAVIDGNYDNSFGSGNDGKPFRRRGLMSFLIRMCRQIVVSYTPDSDSIPPVKCSFLVHINNPYRFNFLKPLGFTLCSATVKSNHGLFARILGENFPGLGNELTYTYYFGKIFLMHGTNFTATV
jgi:hypothetical protein